MSKKILSALFFFMSTLMVSAQTDTTAAKRSQHQRPSRIKTEQNLDEVVVKGIAKKLVVKEDTFIYNANAYKTPEGSTIEELVRRLPGATIDDSGNITINGKTVKKIKVDGKEFMTGDTQTALKNLPNSIVEKVKAYDEKSDLAKMTGVDDGEEQTVLDFGIKPGMNKGLLTNVDLAYGTKKRYAERIMGAYMRADSRIMIFGNANNTNDRGFTSGGRGGMGGGNGLQANKMLAMNYNYEKKDKVRLDLFVRWRHEDSDVSTTTNSENFYSTQSSFGNSTSNSFGRNNSWNFGGRFEWHIDTLTTLQVRPNYSFSSSDSQGRAWNETLNADTLAVNRQIGNSLSYSTSNSFNIQATLSRKLSKKGRNVTLQGRYSYSNSDNENLSRQMTEYPQIILDPILMQDSINYRNRYTVTPTKTWSYRLNATYMEPIAKATFLQLRYQYQYTNRTSDKETDSLDYVNPQIFRDEIPEYRSFEELLQPYQPVSQYKSARLSRNSEDENYRHEIELSLKRTTKKYNLNFGLLLQPQYSRLTYTGARSTMRTDGQDIVSSDKDNVTVVGTRSVTNFTPTLDFRYKWNKRKSLRINYRGDSSLPSMTDLLPIHDDSDPLHIKDGNPDLQPSFTNSLRLNYNNYVTKHQRTIMTFLNYQNTRNSVANRTEYDASTGGTTTKPMNVDGNWNIEGAFMLNTALDSVGAWNLNTFSNISYRNYASYAYLQDTNTTEENWTRTTNFSERLGGSWRNDWMEAELNGQVQYTVSRNKLQPNANLDTWQYQYGADLTFTLPWNMSISTGAHMSSRRGYSEESMNTNEFIWNAQIAQSFLKGKALTLSLQFNDILNQKSSFSRMISANQRTDTWSNNINSYCMLHVIYRFNSFGGRKRGPFGDRERGDRRGGPDGPPPGDFHGGPPPGGGGGHFGGPPGGGPM